MEREREREREEVLFCSNFSTARPIDSSPRFSAFILLFLGGNRILSNIKTILLVLKFKGVV